MITLHAFSSMFPGGIGETKDMRIQWALEEMDLPYRVRGWDYAAGECDTPAFRAISPFGQIPMIEDEALGAGAPALAETAAILIHLAETHGRLTPADAVGRAVVRQWCVAAMATVTPAIAGVAMFDAGFTGQDRAARDFWAGLVRRWFDGLEAHLANDGTPRDWIAAEDFTVADIALAGALREARDMEFLADYPAVRAYYDRCMARPAWRRTRELTAERMGVDLSAIA